MSSWKRYILAGILLFIFFLAYHFPAQLAWSLLAKQGGERLRLYGLNGAWHSGSASVALVMGAPMTEFSWQLRPLPWAPLRLKLAATLGDKGYLQGRIKAGWRGIRGRISLTDIQAELPLGHFASQLARRGLSVDGVLGAQLRHLELEAGIPRRAEGELRLRGLRALAPFSLTLGDFQATISGNNNDGVRLGVRDEGGPLATDGVLLIAPDGHYTLTANLTPRSRQNQELNMVLAFLGPPDRDGVIKINASGKLN